MSTPPLVSNKQVVSYREAFDEVFASPVRITRPATFSLLITEVGELTCAIPLTELRSVLAQGTIARVPQNDVAFLGVCSVRGAISAVWDLGVLLDASRKPDCSLNWFIEPNAVDGVLFAVTRANRQITVPRTTLREDGAHWGEWTTQSIHLEDGVLPVLHLEEITKMIGTRLNSDAKAVMV